MSDSNAKYPVPTPDPETQTVLETVRSERKFAPAHKLVRDPDFIHQKQVGRAADVAPSWMGAFLPDLLAWTLAHYAGIRRLGGPAHVWVFEGVMFQGVYQAFGPWAAGFNPLLEASGKRGLEDSTLATYLGKLTAALIGGRIYKQYVRDWTPGDGPQLAMALDEPPPETEDAEGDDGSSPERIAREPIGADRLRSMAVEACESEQLASVRLSPGQALWLADVLGSTPSSVR